MKLILNLPIIALPLATFAIPQGAIPTGKQLLDLIQSAYGSVKTYEQEITGQWGGPAIQGTAHVWLSRPGRMRVSVNPFIGLVSA